MILKLWSQNMSSFFFIYARLFVYNFIIIRNVLFVIRVLKSCLVTYHEVVPGCTSTSPAPAAGVGEPRCGLALSHPAHQPPPQPHHQEDQ